MKPIWVDLSPEALLTYACAVMPMIPREIVHGIRNKVVGMGTGSWVDGRIRLYELVQNHFTLQFQCGKCAYGRCTSKGEMTVYCPCGEVYCGGIGEWKPAFAHRDLKPVAIVKSHESFCSNPRCGKESEFARNDARGRCYDCNEARL